MARFTLKSNLVWTASALGLALAVAGCTTAQTDSAAAPAASAPAAATAPATVAGGAIQNGATTAMMAQTLGMPKYTTPAPAANAVSQNAAPKVAGTPEPQLLPPPPSSAATPAATPAVAPARAAATAAATPAAAPAAAAKPAVDLAAGRALFNDWSCGACHVLADGNGTGHIGPSFDGNSRMTVESALRIITNGQGAMPGFGGQMTDEEIATISAYLVAAKR